MENPSIISHTAKNCTVAYFKWIHSYYGVVSSDIIWEQCIINLQHSNITLVKTLLKEFGSFIKALYIYGDASKSLRRTLTKLVDKYCLNIRTVNSYDVPCVILGKDSITALSLSFPSSQSIYSCSNCLNLKNMMYSNIDSIQQTMEIYDEDLSTFTKSIWQFEIANFLKTDTEIFFHVRINDVTVGCFSLISNEKVQYYRINLLFPIPDGVLSRQFHNLTLSLHCMSKLLPGDGYVIVSLKGRVLLLKEAGSYLLHDLSVPKFINPAHQLWLL